MSRGPGVQQQRVLGVLAEAPAPMSARSIIAALYADDERPTFALSADVYRALGGLQRRGLVSRIDGGLHRFAITPDGRAWLLTQRAA